MADQFVTVELSNDRGPVTLNTRVIASVRPCTSGHGSLIICAGGAVTSYAEILSRRISRACGND